MYINYCHFLLFAQIRDDSKEYLTQMVLLYSNNNNDVVALAFKSDDGGKLYYVTSQGAGQPLVIDSTIDPPYIFLLTKK